MIKYITAVLAVSVLAVGAWAQSPQHQHNIAASNMIDGAVHPELIPDSTAYGLYLLTVSVPANATEKQRKVQQAHLAKANLKDQDEASLQIVLTEFRSQYEAWVTRWNAAAEAQKEAFDPKPFLQQQADVIQNTRALLEKVLTKEGMTRLHNHIQDEKRNMRVAAN